MALLPSILIAWVITLAFFPHAQGVFSGHIPGGREFMYIMATFTVSALSAWFILSTSKILVFMATVGVISFYLYKNGMLANIVS